MSSIVPYGSSDEEEVDKQGGREKLSTPAESLKQRRQKLPSFLIRESNDDGARGRRLQTSLGTSSEALKGDWLCYVFVPVINQAAVYQVMQDALAILLSSCSQVQAIAEMHISLSKPVLVRHHEKEVVISRTKEAMETYARSLSKRRFPIAFSAFTLLPSEDSCRSFWAVEIGMGWQELRALTTCLDDRLGSIQARRYFEEARFHASFAWVDDQHLGKDEAERCSALLEARLGKRLRGCPPIMVDQIAIATGSQVQQIEL